MSNYTADDLTHEHTAREAIGHVGPLLAEVRV